LRRSGAEGNLVLDQLADDVLAGLAGPADDVVAADFFDHLIHLPLPQQSVEVPGHHDGRQFHEGVGEDAQTHHDESGGEEPAHLGMGGEIAVPHRAQGDDGGVIRVKPGPAFQHVKAGGADGKEHGHHGDEGEQFLAQIHARIVRWKGLFFHSRLSEPP
jgi:hypothetical protein